MFAEIGIACFNFAIRSEINKEQYHESYVQYVLISDMSFDKL
jgi:hypothetical protein